MDTEKQKQGYGHSNRVTEIDTRGMDTGTDTDDMDIETEMFTETGRHRDMDAEAGTET